MKFCLDSLKSDTNLPSGEKTQFNIERTAVVDFKKLLYSGELPLERFDSYSKQEHDYFIKKINFFSERKDNYTSLMRKA